MAMEYLGKGNDDGTSLGNSTTDKISFYGLTPVAQQEVPADAAAVSCTTWNATAIAEVNAINTNLKDLVAELVELGLISQA
jgi:hypothetical protein